MAFSVQKGRKIAYFAFGSNLSTVAFPQPLQTVQHSIRALETNHLTFLDCGRFYETEPIPKSDQPWYVNTVAAYSTSLSGQKLLDWALELEHKIGRERSVPNAARVIDIDLIDWDGQVLLPEKAEQNPLILPHPRAAKRAFVLYPLRDITPNWKHPETKKHIDDLIADIFEEQVLGKQFRALDSKIE